MSRCTLALGSIGAIFLVLWQRHVHPELVIGLTIVPFQ